MNRQAALVADSDDYALCYGLVHDHHFDAMLWAAIWRCHAFNLFDSLLDSGLFQPQYKHTRPRSAPLPLKSNGRYVDLPHFGHALSIRCRSLRSCWVVAA